jgi:hypothetical protein
VTALHSGVNSLAFFCCAILTCPLLPAEELTQIPKFGIVLVLVVVLVLGALGFPDRRETDVMQLICSVSLIAKRDSRGRGTNSEGQVKYCRGTFFGHATPDRAGARPYRVQCRGRAM